MPKVLSAQCLCKKITLNIALEKSLPTRAVCYCEDCRRFVNHLEQTEHYIDAQGGSDTVQLSPAQISIKSGSEHLGLLRLSENGLNRWYATCCNAPLLNTPTNKDMPFVSLLSKNINTPRLKNSRKFGSSQSNNNAEAGKINKQDQRLSALIGPVRFGVGAGARHPIKAAWPVSKGFGFKGIISALRLIARSRLRGDHKISPFIDYTSGKPIVKPIVVS